MSLVTKQHHSLVWHVFYVQWAALNNGIMGPLPSLLCSRWYCPLSAVVSTICEHLWSFFFFFEVGANCCYLLSNFLVAGRTHTVKCQKITDLSRWSTTPAFPFIVMVNWVITSTAATEATHFASVVFTPRGNRNRGTTALHQTGCMKGGLSLTK